MRLDSKLEDAILEERRLKSWFRNVFYPHKDEIRDWKSGGWLKGGKLCPYDDTPLNREQYLRNGTVRWYCKKCDYEWGDMYNSDIDSSLPFAETFNGEMI